MPTTKTSVVSLNSADEGIDDVRQRDAQRLRQDDQPHHAPIGQAQRPRRLVLAARDGGEAAAHHLRHVGGSKQRNADQRANKLVRRKAFRDEQRQHHARHEQDGDQRHAAHEFDEGRRRRSARREVRSGAPTPAGCRAAARTRCRSSRPRRSPECRPTAPSARRASPTIGAP